MTSLGHKRAQHLVEAEAFSRIMAGEAPATLNEFTRHLAEWLNATHPDASSMTPAAIEKQIEDTWHRRHGMIRGGGS